MSSVKRLTSDVGIVGSGPVGLMLSTLLSRYGVEHVILDRKMSASEHPQAHFLHARTMEIIQSYMGESGKSIINSLPPSDVWRDFTYSHTLCGTELHRVNHFTNTPRAFWSSTPSNVAHLAQNKVEHIMRAHVDNTMQSSNSLYLKGYNVTHCANSKEGVTVSAMSRDPATQYSSVELECKYLIGADGSNSFIRRSLGISMKGKEAMQYLMNVHFTCPGLRQLLQPRPAMLYFVFNEAMVAVFVAHDATTDEWVCQIPYFPPFQSAEDFTESAVQKLLAATIASSTVKLSASQRRGDLPVKVNSINSWIMHAQVASRYGNIAVDVDSNSNNNSHITSRKRYRPTSHGNVFLVGDAAHRFPPSGGFGMNTGIQDAHNLAWKLALVCQGRARPEILSQTYDQERRPTAQAITELSLFNYGLTAKLASSLGVDPALAAAAVSASDSTASRALLPFSVRRSAVLAALNTGLYTLKWLRDWRDNVLGSVRVRALQKLIEGGKSLPLIFPEADLEYRYNKGGVVVSPTGACATSAAVIPKKSSAQDGPQLHVGARVPHCWLAPPTEDKSKASLTYVVSTVQLPALADGLNGVSSSSRSIDDTETVHKTCIPTCTIIVDEKHADFVVSALQKVSSNCTKLFCVVAVSESTSSADTHETLQETFQDPRYHVEGDQQQQRTDSSPPSPAREESLAESSTFDARFKGVLSGEEKVDWYASNSGINCLALVDVGGSWKAHTQSYLHDHYGKTSSAHSLAVIVRPDGHVASIVAIQESADVDDEIHLFADAVLDVAKVLHFVV